MARAKKTINKEGNFNMPFPTRLRLLLEEGKPNGVTQETLAQFVGVKRQSISQWQYGITSPDVNYLIKIANYFNVSADYLLGRIDVKAPEIDNMAIHKKIGLSEEAITNLKNILSDGMGAWPKSKYVNLFLSHKELFVWFLNISECMAFTENYNAVESYKKGDYHTKYEELQTKAREMGNCEIIDERHYQDYLLFKSQHHFTIILASLLRELNKESE